MKNEPLDWKSLEFTCKKEKNPPVDPEADSWFKAARALEKRGSEANDAEMIALYKLAAEKGHHKAQLNLAGLYIQGTGVPRDESKAVDLVEKAIQQNSPRAFYLMGVMLQQGVGVKIDETAALSYFRKAADMGDPYGQLAVGESLRNASVNLPEPERRRGYQIALTMLNCSLSQDLPEAGHLLGRHYLNFENDIHQALEYFQRAAALGYNDSLYRLYTIFDEGEYGIQKDPQRAACYYELRKQLKTEPGRRFPDIDRLCPLPPPPARTGTSGQLSPRVGLWHQVGNPAVMFRASSGDTLPEVDGVPVQWEWEASPFEGSRLASGQLCTWPGTWACEDLPVGGRHFEHGEPFP
ncbi:sel1 repeat family protein, partial [Pseudomonas aeruginosa]|nr:sel1 repeat family protein [Pseudomonas aeruginosa]